jgi:hypothetical protein
VQKIHQNEKNKNKREILCHIIPLNNFKFEKRKSPHLDFDFSLVAFKN